MDIVVAAKQQMLGVLLDALKTPAGRPGPGAAPALRPGETVTATVVAAQADGGLVIALKGRQVAAAIDGGALPAEARQPGAILRLRVETADGTPRLALVAAQAPPPQARPAASRDIGEGTAAARAAELRAVRLAVPAPPVAPSSPAAPTALAKAASEAAARQGGAAPLYAGLAALLARADGAVPGPIETLAKAALALRLDGEGPIAPEALKEAIARSGVAHEAASARAAPAPVDAKLIFAALRALAAGERAPASPADLEPPSREAAPAAQRPVPPPLPPEADRATVAAAVARDADRALERLTLHQIASLPEARPGAEAQRPQQLSLELPIAFGQQTAIAGLRIERERRRRKGDGESEGAVDVWGVRFAIDAEGLGPVHAHLRLVGRRVSVSLWAEESGTQGAFRAAIPMLEAALSDNALDVGDLAVFGGRPAEPKRAGAGRFLDANA